MSVWILLAFALFGPPLIGILAPVLSFLALRKRASGRPPVMFIVTAAVVWLLLCAVTAWALQYMAFNFAWSWAHVRRPPLVSEQLTLLGIIAGGLVFLGACAYVLNRLLITARTSSSFARSTPHR